MVFSCIFGTSSFVRKITLQLYNKGILKHFRTGKTQIRLRMRSLLRVFPFRNIPYLVDLTKKEKTPARLHICTDSFEYLLQAQIVRPFRRAFIHIFLLTEIALKIVVNGKRGQIKRIFIIYPAAT